jgi:hypothetical protein
MPRHGPFALERGVAGIARFTNGRIALVRFRPGWRWEFYTVLQRGPERGLEMFVRYLRPDEAERLEAVLATEETRVLAGGAGRPAPVDGEALHRRSTNSRTARRTISATVTRAPSSLVMRAASRTSSAFSVREK